MVFKCKMCGSPLELAPGATIATCAYCGTQQTLPNLNNEKCLVLYDRANHFRRNNEFDKAMAIYEDILAEDTTDAEAYWSRILCRYGIEYVEDPDTHKQIPTVNRAQYTSVFADEDYKAAVKYASVQQRDIYEAEAHQIEEIQKGIISISQKEEPFDVFICYKETDQYGRRTRDSVLAQELYFQLKEEGYKVFFSRITLEDKLGTAYEPYIFAALNSSKVMVALGTKPEHFNAVWVKNEWSRFLTLMKTGQKKMLIPAYRDMDPYDLPVEFSHLQAQDMSKLGFMQDLVRGIKKMMRASDRAANKSADASLPKAASGPNVAPLIKRIFIFLEDGDFESADEYCEKVLDMDPETAEAYLGKLMIEWKVRNRQDLAECKDPLSTNHNYPRLMRYASEKLKAELNEYDSAIKARVDEQRKRQLCHQIEQKLAIVRTPEQLETVKAELATLGDYPPTKQLAGRLSMLEKTLKAEAIYQSARRVIESNFAHSDDLIGVAASLDTIPEYRDAKKMAQEARERATYLTAKRTVESASATEEELLSAARQLDALVQYPDAAALAKRARARITAQQLNEQQAQGTQMAQAEAPTGSEEPSKGAAAEDGKGKRAIIYTLASSAAVVAIVFGILVAQFLLMYMDRIPWVARATLPCLPVLFTILVGLALSYMARDAQVMDRVQGIFAATFLLSLFLDMCFIGDSIIDSIFMGSTLKIIPGALFLMTLRSPKVGRENVKQRTASLVVVMIVNVACWVIAHNAGFL